MKTRKPDQILDEIARQQIHHDVDLSSRIMTAIRKEDIHRMKTKPIVVIAVALVVMITLVVNRTEIVQAMQRLFGYIPGTGMVDTSASFRILKEPAQSTRSDTTVTIKEGVIDLEYTTLLYQVEHLPASSNGETCQRLPELHLPDGSILQGKADTGNTWASGYSRRAQFDPLPDGVNEAVLVFPCLEFAADVPEMQGWEVSLQFISAPPEMTVYPLVDLPTPTSEPAASNPTSAVQSESIDAGQVSLSLDQYVQTDVDFLLYGTLRTSGVDQRIDYVDDSAVHLVDASGSEIPLVFDPSIANDSTAPSDGSTWQLLYRTGGKTAPGTATFTIDSAWISVNTGASFSFDPGANPEPGQVWEINRELNIAGHTITIVNAQVSQFGNGFTFQVEATEDVGGLSLVDPDHTVLGGSGSVGSASFTYQDGIPAGPINVAVTAVSLRVDGPWQVQFDLPAFSSGDVTAESPEACLTKESWKAALNQPGAIPSGVSGTLAMMAISESDGYYRVFTVNTDDLLPEEVASGNYPSLSPDGNSIIFNSADGLSKVDLNTLETVALLNTSKSDSDALYSPDGTRIAFTRRLTSGPSGSMGPRSIVLANPDGSDQKPLLENADANIALAWLPDGNGLLYSVKGPDGSSLRIIDVQTGQVTMVIETNYVNSGAVVSPDGLKIAYEDQLPGEQYAIYVAGIDGTAPRLIANTSSIVTTHPQWSPDGAWLAVSVHDQDLSEMNPTVALINVDTCEVVVIPALQGYVSSWIP